MNGSGVSLLVLVAPFGTALVLGLAIDAMRPMIARLMVRRSDHMAVQCSHIGDPLRLGGLAVFGAFAILVVSVPGLRAAGGLLLLSAVPVLLAGLAEDLGYRVSAAGRFMAALIAALLAIALTGMWVVRIDLIGVDTLMQFAPLAILMTIVFAAGFCHAMNLVDGMNGLAASNVIVSAIGLSLVAGQAGLPGISGVALVLAGAMAGFLPLNWPYGRMFLGDAGAYGSGHLLVWIGVAIVIGAPTVAVPALLLILFWPMADTLHTMLRRFAEGQSILEPDRMHLHQKIRRVLEIKWLGRGARRLSNPVTTAVMQPIMLVPVAAGVLLAEAPALAWLFLVAAFGGFAALHVLITRAAGRRRRMLDTPTTGTAPQPGPGQTESRTIVSSFSDTVEADGNLVDIRIFRAANDPLWQVETIMPERGAVRWKNKFATDKAAWDACLHDLKRVARHGAQSGLGGVGVRAG